MIVAADTVPDELLRKFDVSGPRYTSFPTADRFVEAFTGDDYAQALTHRRSGLAARSLPLSIYVHIPFCDGKCAYCAFYSTSYLPALADRSQAATSRMKERSERSWRRRGSRDMVKDEG